MQMLTGIRVVVVILLGADLTLLEVLVDNLGELNHCEILRLKNVALGILVYCIGIASRGRRMIGVPREE